MKGIKKVLVALTCLMTVAASSVFAGCEALLGGTTGGGLNSITSSSQSGGEGEKPGEGENPGEGESPGEGENPGEGETPDGGCANGKHDFIMYNAVKSTCVKQGWKMYEGCSLCDYGQENKVLLPLDPNNHEHVSGDNVVFRCDDCGTTWGGPQEHTHVWDDGVEELSATCGQDGVLRISCGCGESYTEPIPATGMHQTETLYGYEATCKEFGLTDGVWCPTCGETLKKQEPIPAQGHNEIVVQEARQGDCQTESYTAEIWCDRCQTTIQYAVSTGFGDHVMTTYPSQPADCWNEGWDAYEACALCGYGEMENKKSIPAQHDMEWQPAQIATCVQEGWDSYEKCRVCGHEENKYVYGYDPSNHVNVLEENGYYYCACGASWGDGSGGEIGGCESGNHTLEWVTYQEPTCDVGGWYPYQKCMYCDYVEGEIYYIPAQHNMQWNEGRQPTCYEDGWEGYYACVTCNYGESDKQYRPAQHDMEWQPAQIATCVQEGWDSYEKCRVCGHEENKYVYGYDPSNHVNVLEENGYYYCACGASWGDGSGGGIGGCESGNHTLEWVTYQEPTCDVGGWYPYQKCMYCDYVEGEIYYIPAQHQIFWEPPQEATCSQFGWYGYEYCRICDYTTYQEIPQLEHKEVYEEGYEATCTKTGSTGYTYCEYCGETLKEAEELPMIDHDPVVKESGREPTCDGWGWTAKIWCSVCRKTLQEMVEIEPLPHTPVCVPEQAATCTQKGLTAYEYCEVCKNYIGNEPKETDYAWHNFPVWGEACLDCKAAYYSQGLEYYEEWYIGNIGEYYVWGLGTCTDTDLVIPDELYGAPVTEITLYSNDFAKVGAENITSLSFGSNITIITGNSFEYCTNLTNVYYRGTIGEWVSTHVGSLLYDTEDRVLYIDGKPLTGDVVIPESVTSIGTGAFALQPITSITMGDQVESLGMMAFYYCTSLKEVRLSANIKTIDWSTFDSCTALTKIEMKGVEVLESDAFWDCSSLKSVDLPSVKTIKMRAFQNCYNLEEVKCGENLTTIGSSAFRDCMALKSITLPDALTKIDSSAFSGCESLTSFTIGKNVTFIGRDAFDYCEKLTNVYFEETEGWTYNRYGTIYEISGLDDAEKAAKLFEGIAGSYDWTRA